MNNYGKAYGVFCIAIQLPKEEQNTRSADVWWHKAIELYEEFVNSEFNDYNQSELDCINKFMDNKINKH